MNKQNRNRLIDTDNKLMLPDGKDVWRLGENGGGVEMSKLAVIEKYGIESI